MEKTEKVATLAKEAIQRAETLKTLNFKVLQELTSNTIPNSVPSDKELTCEIVSTASLTERETDNGKFLICEATVQEASTKTKFKALIPLVSFVGDVVTVIITDTAKKNGNGVWRNAKVI